MANAHVAHQTAHVPVAKHIAHHAVVLAQEQPVAVAGDNTRRILSPVLKDSETFVKLMTHRRVSNNTYDSAQKPATPLRDDYYKNLFSKAWTPCNGNASHRSSTASTKLTCQITWPT